MTRRRLSDAEVRGLAEELRALLGGDRVLDGADERNRHGSDESFHPAAPPDIVVYPQSTDEVAAVVRACSAAGAPMIPFGAGTSVEGQVGAVQGGVSIDTLQMDKIVRCSIEDLDVTVEAGVRRRQLDAYLRPRGVFFPVDPGADASIGGMIATRATGTTTVRYGGMPANVLSLTVVTAQGEIMRTGSRARKTAAGYDLTRLFIGSEGTLGIVCEATLRVHPTPEAAAAVVCAFRELAGAVDCAIAVIQHAIPVARIELADELQIQASNRYDDADRPVAPTLFLELHGTPHEVKQQALDVGELAEEHGIKEIAVASNEGERAALWRTRHRAYDAARALRRGTKGMVTDACVPVSALTECILDARRKLDELQLTAPIVGHVGDGNFHAQVLVDPDDPGELERAEAFRSYLAYRAIELGGTCTGEHGVGIGKAAYLEAEYGSAGVRAMQAVQHALDPGNIFNPGKNVDAVPGRTS